VLFRVLEPRIRLSRDLQTGWTILLFGTLIAIAIAATIPRGGPVEVVRSTWHSFNGSSGGSSQPGGGASQPSARPSRPDSLNDRLFNAASNGRKELWTVALDDWHHHLLVGAGAGTFTSALYARADRTLDTENAHSLYFETLAELGIVGELLLLLVVLTPLAAAIRARHEPLVATAAAGYLVVIAQAAVDTDWESPGVIVPALLLGGAVVAAARRRRPVGPATRGGLVAFAIVLAALSGYALSANRAIDAASATTDTAPCAAIRDAQRATDRMPWSARAWQALAGARINAGDAAGARAAYAKALDWSPTDFRLWYASGAVQDPAHAAAAFARARQLNPKIQPGGAIPPFDPVEFPRVNCS
jgi:hypothetical protein